MGRGVCGHLFRTVGSGMCGRNRKTCSAGLNDDDKDPHSFPIRRVPFLSGDFFNSEDRPQSSSRQVGSGSALGMAFAEAQDAVLLVFLESHLKGKKEERDRQPRIPAR